MPHNSKGFTIIELLVVIAIIAVLASIVLVNVTQYITKGNDSAAEENLNTILTNGTIFYTNNGTYTGFDTAPASTITTAGGCLGDSTFIAPCVALMNAGYGSPVGLVQYSNTTNWCASITLKSNGYTSDYCVDSTGAKTKSSGAVCGNTALSGNGITPDTCHT